METTLKDTLKKLNNLVDDLSSLHVQTYTGTINLKIDDPKKGRTYTDIDTAIENGLKAEDDTKIKLVAESLYKFDGDSYNFLSSDNDVSTKALELHTSAVKSGLETRQGLINMAKDTLGF